MQVESGQEGACEQRRLSNATGRRDLQHNSGAEEQTRKTQKSSGLSGTSVRAQVTVVQQERGVMRRARGMLADLYSAPAC